MSYELKACKACKACESTNVKYYTYDSELNKYETHNAQCLDCGYNSCGHKTKKAMLKAWNTRPIEDALRQRVKELEAELEAIKIADRKDSDMACHYYLKCQKLEAWQKEAVPHLSYDLYMLNLTNSTEFSSRKQLGKLIEQAEEHEEEKKTPD